MPVPEGHDPEDVGRFSSKEVKEVNPIDEIDTTHDTEHQVTCGILRRGVEFAAADGIRCSGDAEEWH